MGVATTKIKVHVHKIISKFRWETYFPVTVGGDEVVNVKPDPEIFQVILKRLQASPGETLVIGDTENDIIGAHAVPMKAVAVSSPYGGRDRILASGPDYFIEELSELPELLTKISEGVKS